MDKVTILVVDTKEMIISSKVDFRPSLVLSNFGERKRNSQKSKRWYYKMIIRRIISTLLLISIMLSFSTWMAAAAVEQRFTDLPEAHWAYENVQKLADAGIVDGYPDGTFRPGASVTEAEFVKMAVTAGGGFDYDYWDQYAKSKGGVAWFDPYYCYIEENWGDTWHLWIAGMNGNAGNKANSLATRYITTQIACAALEVDMNETLSPFPAASFTNLVSDYGRIAEYSSLPFNNFQDAVGKCYQAGIIAGYPDGSFSGENALTRAEAATIICRLIYPEMRTKAAQQTRQETYETPTSAENETFEDITPQKIEESNYLDKFLSTARIRLAFSGSTDWSKNNGFVNARRRNVGDGYEYFANDSGKWVTNEVCFVVDKDTKHNSASFTATSSDDSVAIIYVTYENENWTTYRIKAVGEGKATITIKCNERPTTYKEIVINSDSLSWAEDITKISIRSSYDSENSDIVYFLGRMLPSFHLIVSRTPLDAYTNISVSVSDPSILTLEKWDNPDTYSINAKREGTVTVTAAASNGVSAQLNITVVDIISLREREVSNFISRFISDDMDDISKINTLCRYIKENYRYSTYISSELGWFYQKEGDCVAFANGTATFLNAMGYDAGPVRDLRPTDPNAQHVVTWVEINNELYIVDTSIRSELPTYEFTYAGSEDEMLRILKQK